MNILIPFDNQGWHSQNPFTTQLLESLALQRASIFSGKHWLASEFLDFDIINLHWPEYLLPDGMLFAEGVECLSSALAIRKRKSKIVATIHNQLPHHDKSHGAYGLYKDVYAQCDGFVHMGEESIRVIHRDFPAQAFGKSHIVIPHGNYQAFGPRIDRVLAKNILSLYDKPTALIVGALRSAHEVRLAQKMINTVVGLGGQVIFAAALPSTGSSRDVFTRITKRVIREAREISALWPRMSSGNVLRVAHPVPFDKISLLVSASDVVLIPRSGVLNSGNVPLGFTYGSVVVGPNCGNIGEILNQTGNIAYMADASRDEITCLISKAFDLARKGLGELNYKLARDEWAWHKVGRLYVDYFRSIA